MKRKSIIIGFLSLTAVGIISAALVYSFVYNKPHKNYEKAKPAYIISANDLYNSFKSDREDAEKKYNGQVVLLRGKLDKVEVSDNNVTGVFVFPMHPPARIVCLTEETVETLYLLGEEHRIAGVSGYAVRPPRVCQGETTRGRFHFGRRAKNPGA